MHRSTDDVGLHDDRGNGHAALQAVTLNEVHRLRRNSECLLAHQRTTAIKYLVGKLAVFGRVNLVESVCQDSYRVTMDVERGSMGLGINSFCQAAYDTPPLFGQERDEPARHLRA